MSYSGWYEGDGTDTAARLQRKQMVERFVGQEKGFRFEMNTRAREVS